MIRLQPNLEIDDDQSPVGIIRQPDHETLADSTTKKHARNVLSSDNEDVVYHLYNSAEQKHTNPYTDNQWTVLSFEKSTAACEAGDD